MLAGCTFAHHAADLWPAGEPAYTPSWIATHTDEILATSERFYAATIARDHPGRPEFLDRMRWLQELLQILDQPRRGTCVHRHFSQPQWVAAAYAVFVA